MFIEKYLDMKAGLRFCGYFKDRTDPALDCFWVRQAVLTSL